MSEKWKEDPTAGGKYTGEGVRIKAQNLLQLDLTNKGPVTGGLICYVSRGGNNIARFYSHPADYKAKIKELIAEDRYYTAYLITLQEVEKAGNGSSIADLDIDGLANVLKGPSSVN